MFFVSVVQTGDRDAIAAIAALERFSPSPWSKTAIEKELEIPYGLVLGAQMRAENTLVGWCCLRILPPEAELLKIAVHPDAQGRGIATGLLQNVFKICKKKKCETVFLEVRGKNATALTLYQKTGFHQRGVRKRYYVSPIDDGILLARTIAQNTNNTTL